MRQRVLGLRGEINQDATLGSIHGGLGDSGLDDGVEAFVTVHDNGRGVARIKTHQCAVGTVGIEAEEGLFVVDQVLREQPCDQRFADPALFAADEVDVCHR